MDQKALKASLSHWGQSRIISSLTGGYRNQAWLVEIEGQLSVAKTTRRSEPALQWLSLVHDAAEAAGFVVPRLISSPEDALAINGITVEPYIEGHPATPEEMAKLAHPLACFHRSTRNTAQRPTFASSIQLLDQDAGGDVDFSPMPPVLVAACRNAWQIFNHEPQSAVHGDLNCSNVLITPSGQPALIDWDEARVDASVFDRLAIASAGQQTFHEQRALQAWEVAVCWQIEPDYAQRLAQEFMR